MVKRQYHVSLNQATCKACGLCIEFCPADVFAALSNGKAMTADQEACTGCRSCEEHCPDFCIEIKEVADE